MRAPRFECFFRIGCCAKQKLATHSVLMRICQNCFTRRWFLKILRAATPLTINSPRALNAANNTRWCDPLLVFNPEHDQYPTLDYIMKTFTQTYAVGFFYSPILSHDRVYPSIKKRARTSSSEPPRLTSRIIIKTNGFCAARRNISLIKFGLLRLNVGIAHLWPEYFHSIGAQCESRDNW